MSRSEDYRPPKRKLRKNRGSDDVAGVGGTIDGDVSGEDKVGEVQDEVEGEGAFMCVGTGNSVKRLSRRMQQRVGRSRGSLSSCYCCYYPSVHAVTAAADPRVRSSVSIRRL